MKTMKSKLASLGLALIMAMTMILSNVGIANVQAADTVTVNGEAKDVVERVTLTPGHTADTIVQFVNVYDFGVEDNDRLGFSGTLKLDGEVLEAESQFYFSGYKDNTTICLNFGLVHQNKVITIEKDSVIYSGDKAVVITETFNQKWNENGEWTVPAPAPKEPEQLTISGVHWGNDTVLMLKSNLPTSIGAPPKADAKDINEEGSAQKSIQIRSLTNGNQSNEQLLVIDFATAYEKNTNYVLKKGSSVTFAGTEYILDNDVAAYFDGEQWKDGTAPAPEKPVHTHKYVKTVVKATTTKAGSITEKCACGEVKSKTTINPASKISLSKTTLTYNKKTQKVTLSVKDSKGKTISASQYSVSGTLSAKTVGNKTVTIRFKGNYSGTKTLTWKINPQSTKVTSVKAAKKSLTVKWAKQTAETKGYKIQVSTDKNFKKDVKTVTINSNKTTSKKITGLKKNKKYYVRICTIKGSNASTWTKYSKSVKVK